jgi:hypothetical protein
MGKCTTPKSKCGNCDDVTNDIGSFTCVNKTDSCGNQLYCACLLAGQKCAECPVSCQPGAKNQCEGSGLQGPQMCCPLGPGAGGFCVGYVSNADASLPFDAGMVSTSCPATCDPCGGGGCSNNDSCCPIIKRNKHAGACVPGSVCPLPQCDPESCSDQGYDCGEWTDGCGHPLNCGSCTSPEVCGGGGPPGVCAVPPDGPPEWDAGEDAGFCGN